MELGTNQNSYYRLLEFEAIIYILETSIAAFSNYDLPVNPFSGFRNALVTI